MVLSINKVVFTMYLYDLDVISLDLWTYLNVFVSNRHKRNQFILVRRSRSRTGYHLCASNPLPSCFFDERHENFYQKFLFVPKIDTFHELTSECLYNMLRMIDHDKEKVDTTQRRTKKTSISSKKRERKAKDLQRRRRIWAQSKQRR